MSIISSLKLYIQLKLLFSNFFIFLLSKSKTKKQKHNVMVTTSQSLPLCWLLKIIFY